MSAGNRIGLTLGPLLYLWDQPAWSDFYSRIADEAEVDSVVLGEVVCSKRDHFHAGAEARAALLQRHSQPSDDGVALFAALMAVDQVDLQGAVLAARAHL